MLEKKFLELEYIDKGKSAAEIADKLDCSAGKVNYWLSKYGIPKRNLSQSQYLKQNPNGNPYKLKKINSKQDWFLYGLGLGLWWGEGNKVSKSAIRLGNTDADLINYFLLFLREIYQVDESRLRFGLQIFSDINPRKAKTFWCKELNVHENKFQKIVVSKPVNKGTYRRKCEYGVLTIYFSNTKIRDNIYDAIQALRTEGIANIAQSVERIHGGSQ